MASCSSFIARLIIWIEHCKYAYFVKLFVLHLSGECDRFSETTYDVVFPNGTTKVTFPINITNDDIYEGDESFTLQIQGGLPNLVTLGEPSIATVVIQEDEDSK